MTVLRSRLISVVLGVGWIVLVSSLLPDDPSLWARMLPVVPATLIFLYLPRALRAVFGPGGWWWTATRRPETEDDRTGA